MNLLEFLLENIALLTIIKKNKRNPMSSINRDIMIIIPKKPLIDWQNTIFPENPLSTDIDPFKPDEGTAFLIPEMDAPEEFEKWIKKNYKIFFEGMLDEWCTDENLWPKNLTYKMFREWFTVMYQSMLIDTLDMPIIREDDDE
jgi:hypothetical protein